MESSSNKTTLELFELGPCEEPYTMGFLIGQRFADLIKSRVASDLVLQQQLLPFAHSLEAQPLMQALTSSNKLKFPEYWDELLGTAKGSDVPVLQIILLNFRKELLPFLPKPAAAPPVTDNDCSDVLVVSDSLAIAAHNEDANIALVGHTYLVRAVLTNGASFTAYTYAGELPSCAFGYNSHGLAFTLNSVPPTTEEILAGGIGRNFMSRALLEATNLGDALQRIQSCNVSVGHSYNLVDVRCRRILNVETASSNRVSVHEVGATPFFHANMYLHLQVQQEQDENSISRQRRASMLSVESKTKALSVLGDTNNAKYPIYMIGSSSYSIYSESSIHSGLITCIGFDKMSGPTLYTLCTALIDINARTLTIYEGNPRKEEVSYVFPI